MRKYLFAVIFLLTSLNSLLGQEAINIEPLQRYYKKAESLITRDYDDARLYIDSLNYYSAYENSIYYKGVGLYMKARIKMINSKFDSAFFYIQHAQNILSDFSDSVTFYKAIYSKGNIYMEMGDHFQALREFKKCIQLLDQRRIETGELDNVEVELIRAYCFSRIGNIYGQIGDYVNEKVNLQRSMHIASNLKGPEIKKLELTNSINLSYSYYQSGELNLAEKLATENLSAKEAYGYKYSLGQNYQILALIAIKREKYSLALAYLDQSDEKIRPFMITKELIRNDYYRSKCLFAQGKLDRAEKILLEIESKVEQFFSSFELAEYYEYLARIYEANHDFPAAIAALEKSNIELEKDSRTNSYFFLDDFVKTIENNGVEGMDTDVQVRLGSIRSQMDKEKRLIQIVYEKQKKNWIFGILLICLIGLIVVMTLIYYSYKRIKKKNESLKNLADEKKVLFQEVHHRVKNNFQVISSMLNLQASFSLGESTNNALLESKLRIQSMALVHNLIYKDEEIRNISFEEYTTKLFEIVKNAGLNEITEIELVKSFDIVRPNLDEAVPLGLVMNEILSLIFIKCFENQAFGKITIDFRQLQNEALKYRLKVGHNGPINIHHILKNNDAQLELAIGLIEALTEQLGTEMIIEESGEIIIVIEFSEYE